MKKVYQLAIFAIIEGCTFFTWFVLLLSGTATPFIYCFAVDSSDRIYIGGEHEIYVYDHGHLIDRFRPPSDDYMFTIDKTDNIILTTTTQVYTMDLRGNIIDVYDDSSADMYNQLQYRRKFTSVNGDTYKRVWQFGLTRIVKNDVEIVYQINTLSVMTKILIYLTVLSLPIFFIVWHLWERHMKTRKGD